MRKIEAKDFAVKFDSSTTINSKLSSKIRTKVSEFAFKRKLNHDFKRLQ